MNKWEVDEHEQTIVWVCDQRGILIYKFHIHDQYFQIPPMDIFLVTMCVSDKNEIIAENIWEDTFISTRKEER